MTADRGGGSRKSKFRTSCIPMALSCTKDRARDIVLGSRSPALEIPAKPQHLKHNAPEVRSLDLRHGSWLKLAEGAFSVKTEGFTRCLAT